MKKEKDRKFKRTREQRIRKWLVKANLEEMIGQMLMVGVEGKNLSFSERAYLRDYRIGNIVLFERNIDNKTQLKGFCQQIKEYALSTKLKIPFLISVDQEGGKVSRIKDLNNDLPGNDVLGKLSPEEVYKLSFNLAKELLSLNINMNLSPVLDVDTNPNNPIIGKRSFGGDVNLVSKMGISMILGFHDGGIIAVGKHFPGHGDTEVNSHLNMPIVKKSLAELEEIEIKPFAEAVKNGLSVIMTAHVKYEALDREYPATLSQKIVSNLLREKLGFEGVVISDDLTMKALTLSYDFKEAVIKTIEAGVDIILVGKDREKGILAYESILEGVQKGFLKEERILESFKRIAKLKGESIK